MLIDKIKSLLLFIKCILWDYPVYTIIWYYLIYTFIWKFIIKWLLWEFIPFRFILTKSWEKISPPINPETGVRPPATFLIWVSGIFSVYIALFGIASQRYEARVDVIENRANSFFAQLGIKEIRKETLSRVPSIQTMPCPQKPELFKANTVIESLFFENVEYSGIVTLMKETLVIWKVYLKDVNLSEVDLSEADLIGAKLKGADLFFANLKGADLIEADLTNANIEQANLISANLKNADLENAYLSEADLSEANLSGAKLKGADLSFANLKGAELVGADLRETNLNYANLEGADLEGASIYYDYDELEYVDLEYVDLEDIDLVDVLYSITLPYGEKFLNGVNFNNAKGIPGWIKSSCDESGFFHDSYQEEPDEEYWNHNEKY